MSKVFLYFIHSWLLRKNYTFLFLSVLLAPHISVVVTSVGFVAPENRYVPFVSPVENDFTIVLAYICHTQKDNWIWNLARGIYFKSHSVNNNIPIYSLSPLPGLFWWTGQVSSMPSKESRGRQHISKFWAVIGSLGYFWCVFFYLFVCLYFLWAYAFSKHYIKSKEQDDLVPESCCTTLCL